MTTPRKYPTLDEFNELKEVVVRLEKAITGDREATSEPAKKDVPGVLVPVLDFDARPKSCLARSSEIAERMAIRDRNGAGVSVGDWVKNDYTKSIHRITSMTVREPEDKPGMSTVMFFANVHHNSGRSDSEIIRVVDGKICGFTVVEFVEREKATA